MCGWLRKLGWALDTRSGNFTLSRHLWSPTGPSRFILSVSTIRSDSGSPEMKAHSDFNGLFCDFSSKNDFTSHASCHGKGFWTFKPQVSLKFISTLL